MEFLNKAKPHLMRLGEAIIQGPANLSPRDEGEGTPKLAALDELLLRASQCIRAVQAQPLHVSLIVSAFIASVQAYEMVCLVFFIKKPPTQPLFTCIFNVLG